MRRIYESNAIRRDDSDPFAPNERQAKDRPQAMRSVPTTWLSKKLVPDWLRHRAIVVSIDSPREEYPHRSAVPFTVRMRNVMPFPVTITTRSPILWSWEVDGHTEASLVTPAVVPDEPAGFKLDRGQRVRFERRWNGMFQIADDEWEWAEPGEYTLGVGLNVDDAAKKGLYDETTVRIIQNGSDSVSDPRVDTGTR